MSPSAPPWEALREIVARAVAEDLPEGDPTGASVGPLPASASIVARRAGTIAGLCASQLVLDEVSDRLGSGKAVATLAMSDGGRVGAGTFLGELDGPAGTLLAAERTVLNIVTHLSGIATMTAAFVEAVSGTGAVVRDTRKTLPGLRAAEKYAVRCGGGANHRMSLSDALLVKDNHIAALGGVKAAVEAARRQAQTQAELRGRREPLALEVEVDTLEELDEALAAGAGLVLVDNMSLEDTAEAVRRADAVGAEVEASGGLSLANVRAVAACGVHYVAVGALTHSAPALDIGLDWRIGG
ncbi:MAG: carboxylating nicotinate-nucleotide diphosphorylase [Acidimicrobiales bacterium]